MSTNQNTLAIQKIKELNALTWGSNAYDITVGRNLVRYVANNSPKLPVFKLTEKVSEYGAKMKALHDDMLAHMDRYDIDDMFIQGTVNWYDLTMRDILQSVPANRMAEARDMLKEMVETWIEAANEYEENRRKSAKKQLENAMASEEEVNEVMATSQTIRKYIHKQRDDMVQKLTEIKKQIDDEMPGDIIKASDRLLYDKHAPWFLTGSIGEDEYYPNDGAVHYPFLLMEVASLIKGKDILTGGQLYARVEAFMQYYSTQMSKDSSRAVWNAMKQLTSFDRAGFDMGTMLKNYCSDETRNIPDGGKQSHPFGRSPLRLLRIAQLMFKCPGPFTVVNSPSDLLMTNLLDMRLKELEIIEITKKASFITAGAEGFSIALSALWLLVLQRPSISYVLTGRNDLSVPKILQDITGISVKGLADLRPRLWSLDQDIKGTTDPEDVPENPEQEPTPVIVGGGAEVSIVPSDPTGPAETATDPAPNDTNNNASAPITNDPNTTGTAIAPITNDPNATGASSAEASATPATATGMSIIEAIQASIAREKEAVPETELVSTVTPPVVNRLSDPAIGTTVTTPQGPVVNLVATASGAGNETASTPATPTSANRRFKFPMTVTEEAIATATLDLQANEPTGPTFQVTNPNHVHALVRLYLLDAASSSDDKKAAFDEDPATATINCINAIRKEFMKDGYVTVERISDAARSVENW